MKKILSIISIFFLFLFSPVFADEVNQDEEESITLNSVGAPNFESLSDKKLYQQDDSDFYKGLSTKDERYYNTNDNAKSNLSYTFSKKINNSTYGTKLNSSMTSDTASQAVTLFREYEKKNFSLNTSYKTAVPASFSQETSGTVSLAPSYKLNKNLAVKNVLSSDLQSNQKKSEVVLSVNPLKTDRMKVDFGAGQVLDTENDVSRTQFNFTTKFRF